MTGTIALVTIYFRISCSMWSSYHVLYVSVPATLPWHLLLGRLSRRCPWPPSSAPTNKLLVMASLFDAGSLPEHPGRFFMKLWPNVYAVHSRYNFICTQFKILTISLGIICFMFLFVVSFMPAQVQSVLELIGMPSSVVVALLLAILQNNLIMRGLRTCKRCGQRQRISYQAVVVWYHPRSY